MFHTELMMKYFLSKPLEFSFLTTNFVKKTVKNRNSGFTLINFLQKTIKVRPIGFTLIELLVVIAILGILMTLGFAAYRGLQANARDTKRRSEINSIANALEIRFQATSGGVCDGQSLASNGGTYCPLVTSWFANNTVPVDVNASSTPYCIWYNATTTLSTITPAASNISNGNCTAITGAPSGTNQAVIAASVPAVNAASFWKACAVMEKDGTVYCINSKQ